MGFLVNKITGDGKAQTAITNDATLEAVVNSLVAYNTTGGALTFSVLIDGSVIFTERVSANSSYRIPDKINLSAAKVLSIIAATGVNVTVSYLQQAIDVAGALSAAQLLAQQAEADADRAEAALGTLASPVVTGGINIGGSIKETAVAIVASDIDCSLGNVFSKTVSTPTTFTVSNVPAAGKAYTMILELTDGGVGTTYWAGVQWAGGKEPTLSASGKDKLGFMTTDGGTTWTGFKLALDVKAPV